MSVIPFRGIYYDTGKVSPDDVCAPPYDVISEELKDILYSKSPYNIVRVDFGKDMPGDSEGVNDRYTRARQSLRAWMEEGALIRSPKPCYYAYEMDYEVKGKKHRLLGFFGLVKLVELGKGVYPHEATHSKPKKDRLTMLQVCKANTSPIYSLYKSPERKASGVLEKTVKTCPYMAVRDAAGAFHKLWIIEGEDEIDAITEDLADKPIFIADGHHRYETALENMKLSKTPESGHVLMFLANMEDKGITALPTHRLVTAGQGAPEKLKPVFDLKEIPSETDIEKAISGKDRTMGVYHAGRLYTARFKGGSTEEISPALAGLDVAVLHEVVFKKLLGDPQPHYEMDAHRARVMVDSGAYDTAFFLNPTGLKQVEAVALSSLRMPPKSTYFYPKILTGLVINSFENNK